jgi:tRNA dimethylallyltransferase
MNNILIVLLGPTGVGKTEVSLITALHFGIEIISCDSRQFYRELKIGTAVPSEEQLKSVKHHFIRFLSVEDYYSSCRFEKDVLNILPEIFSRKNIALMTGGSGLYIDSVCNSIDDIPDVDYEIREKYIRKYKEEGLESLRVALKLLDPEHYAKVDLRNPKRIIRALEICDATGRPYSSFLSKEKKSTRDFRILKIGLERDRKDLYNRINMRVDQMVDAGLKEEVKGLVDRRKLNALNTVGYKEFFEYFDGNITEEKAVELIKRNSRRYAKRQMTWWSKDKDIHWFHPENITGILNFIEQCISDTNAPSDDVHSSIKSDQQ